MTSELSLHKDDEILTFQKRAYSKTERTIAHTVEEKCLPLAKHHFISATAKIRNLLIKIYEYGTYFTCFHTSDDDGFLYSCSVSLCWTLMALTLQCLTNSASSSSVSKF